MTDLYLYTYLARKGHFYLYEETSPKQYRQIVETKVPLEGTALSAAGRTSLITNRLLRKIPTGGATTDEVTSEWLRS